MAETSTEPSELSYLNPQGYKFSDSLPLQADYAGIGMPSPLHIGVELPDESPPRLPHFDAFDYTKRFQASAILTEHDLEARASATEEMKTNPLYAALKYGEASYFNQWEELVRGNIQRLIREKGAPHHTFDGATGLPIVSVYANAVYNQNRMTGRRHSLVTDVDQLFEPQYLQKQKLMLRRMSLSYKAGSRPLPPLRTIQKPLKFETEYKMEIIEEEDEDEGSE